MGRRWRRALLVLGLLLLVAASNLWLATTQAGAALLLAALRWQSSPVSVDTVREKAQAIAVLGGRTSRIEHGARLHLATGVPLLIVGRGSGASGFRAESEKMEDVLLRQYGVGPRWVETESRDTRENARFAWCLVSSMGVRRVVLVTHPHHMPRARREFERAGFDVIPAPTPDAGPPWPSFTWSNFVPSRQGLKAARQPVHEWIGILLSPVDFLRPPARQCPYLGTRAPGVHPS